MNVGITCFPTFGGSGIIATEIGLALARRGHRVHFLCAALPARLERFVENAGTFLRHEVAKRATIRCSILPADRVRTRWRSPPK